MAFSIPFNSNTKMRDCVCQELCAKLFSTSTQNACLHILLVLGLSIVHALRNYPWLLGTLKKSGLCFFELCLSLLQLVLSPLHLVQGEASAYGMGAP